MLLCNRKWTFGLIVPLVFLWVYAWFTLFIAGCVILVRSSGALYHTLSILLIVASLPCAFAGLLFMLHAGYYVSTGSNTLLVHKDEENKKP